MKMNFKESGLEKIPIIHNLSICLAHGANSSLCWIDYNLNLSNVTNASTIPNLLGIEIQNLPWVGMGIWLVTYVALLILFHKSGGREKFMAMGIGGWLASIVYAQAGLLGSGTTSAGIFTFSFFMMVISIIAYALIKDASE